MRSSESVYYIPLDDVDIYCLGKLVRSEETCLVQLACYDECLGLTIVDGNKADIARDLDIDPRLLSIHYEDVCNGKPLNSAVLVRV